MKKLVILILTLSILLIGIYFVIGTSAAVYKANVDQDGFYRVISMDKNQTVSYGNRTLTINVSDNVIWVNSADPDEPLTIMSEQGLWDNTSAKLRWNYKVFNYTFNESGTYSFYIREYPRRRQIIIVNATEILSPSPKITLIVEQTPTVTQVVSETPTVVSTEVPIKAPTEPSDNIVIMFGIIVIIIVVAILLTLYLRKFLGKCEQKCINNIRRKNK